MQHTRKEYLAQCQICYKRKFTLDEGIICALTNERAAFQEEKCPEFDLDQPAFDNKAAGDRRRTGTESSILPKFLTDFGIKSEITLGVILVIIGMAWLIIGLVNFWIFAYPIAMIVIGFIFITVGIIGKIRKN